MIHGLAERSGGGTLGALFPHGNPPLDHEDGMVYGACRALSGDDPLANVYCVTRDRGFLEAYRDGLIGRYGRVITPSTFVSLVRVARFHHSMRRLPGKS